MKLLFDTWPYYHLIGCRVRIIHDSDGCPSYDGLLGTIVAIQEAYYHGSGIGIDLDICHTMKPHPDGHKLDGRISTNTGRWVSFKDVEVIN